MSLLRSLAAATRSSPLGSWMGPAGLVVAVVAFLAYAPTGRAPILWTACGGLAVYLASQVPVLPAKGRVFLGLAAITGAAAWVLEVPSDALREGLYRAVFIASLFTMFGYLRDPAEASPRMQAAGRYLAARRPGRRYAAMTFGGHLMALALGIGVVHLLGTMVTRATADTDNPHIRLRRRRMLSAVARAFIVILAWSPASLAVAVVLSDLPETSWGAVAPWCAGYALMMLLAGWALDRFVKAPDGRVPPPPESDAGARVLLPVLGLVALVFGLGAAWSSLLGVRLVIGVMTAAPLVGMGWVMLQCLRDGAGRGAAVGRFARRVERHVTDELPSHRLEVAVLSSAVFAGSVAVALVPTEALSSLWAAVPLPGWALLSVLAVLVVALAQVGLHPVLLVTAVSGALPAPGDLGVPAAAVAVALTAAWALSAASSPYAAVTLLMGRIGGETAATVGRRWNGPWTLACLAILAVWLLVLTQSGA
ncbi:hypothetical protein [Caenispirillum salinarum]|uniref:hypothetical protein n=1 Tax=Caenispirillum salinarum TaxID=859058 RepID=UPI00384AC997